MSNNLVNIGLRFETALKEAGFYRKKNLLAEKIGITAALLTEISKWRAKPNIKILRYLEEEHGISSRWILLGSGDMWLAADASDGVIDLDNVDPATVVRYNGRDLSAASLKHALEQVWLLRRLDLHDIGDAEDKVDSD